MLYLKRFFLAAFFIALAYLAYPKPYTSSPGFVPIEAAQEFEKTKKTCQGISVHTNSEEVSADAPGQSLCFGILRSPKP